MELLFREKTCEFLRRAVHESSAQEETADLIVPDSFPDVQRIVYCSASAIIRSKECRAGSVSVSGGIRAAALYVPEDDPQPRVLDLYMPFTIRTDHPSVTEQMQTVIDCFVRAAECKMLNSRKVMFRINLGCTVDGYVPDSETLYEPQELPPELQVRRQTYPLLLPAETAEKSFPISEDLSLPSGKAPISQILSWDCSACVEEQKIVGNKAVFKGSLFVQVLYLSEDGTPDSVQLSTPFSQYCELSGDYADEDLQITLVQTGAQLETDSAADGRKLMLLVQMLAQCVISRAENLEVYEDAYAVGAVFTPQWKTYQIDARLDRQTLHLPIRQSIQTEASAVVDSAVYMDFPQVQYRDGGAEIRIPASVNLLYYGTGSDLQGITAHMEAVTQTALSEQASCSVRAKIRPDGYSAAVGDGIELRYEAEADVVSYAEQELRTLCGGTLEKAERCSQQRPSVILFTNRSRKTVWEIAKQYGAGVNAVKEANQIVGDEVGEGELLLIPM